MKENKKVLIGIISLIISLVLTFALKNIIGIIFAIIALIIGIINLKQKNIIAWLLFIGSLLLIVYYIFTFITSFSKVNNIVSNSKYKNYEYTLEYEAEKYLEDKNMNNQSIVVTIKQLEDNGMEKYNYNCDGYVIYNYDTNVYNAYIKCDGYQTDGFEEDKL